MTAQPNHERLSTNCSPAAATNLRASHADWLNDPDGARIAREALARRAIRNTHFTHAAAGVHDRLVAAARDGRLPSHLSIRSFSPVADGATFVVDVGVGVGAGAGVGVGAHATGRPCCGIERVLVRMSQRETSGECEVERFDRCEMEPVFHRPVPRHAPGCVYGPADEAVAMLVNVTL
jgi:hypothetical protein